MKYKLWNLESKLRICLLGMFIIYIILLFRITLFKQTSLYNLFSAIGTGERALSLIPFGSIFEMIQTGISAGRIAENVFGNILLFFPFGVIFPVLSANDNADVGTNAAGMKKISREEKKTLTAALALSFFIEITQLLLALGVTDIDDLLFNVLGAYIGYLLYNKIRKTYIIAGIMAAFGILVFGYLLVFQTSLFSVSRYETTVENGELVASFIETGQDFSGKFLSLDNSILTAEKSVSNASQEKTCAEFMLTKESRIYICYDKIKFFFSTISGEHQRYEQISYEEVDLQKENFDHSNVQIWSKDGRIIDYLVLIRWIE